jgi:predicted alpha/beta hydrolase
MQQPTQQQINDMKDWRRWRKLQENFTLNPFRIIVQQAAIKRPWVLVNDKGKVCKLNQEQLTVYSNKMNQILLNEEQYEQLISFYREGKDVLWENGTIKEWIEQDENSNS